MNARCLRGLVPAIGLALLLVSAGCHHRHHRHSNHPTAAASPVEFSWHGDLHAYSAVDEYGWDTVFDGVFVEFEAFHFWGDVRVEIFDDDFVCIYDQTFVGNGGYFYALTESALGYEGDWTVVITSFDVDGDLFLTLD